MKYKVYIAIILWYLGLRKVLPSEYINRKTIKENDCPLIDISKDDTFSFDETALRYGGLWVRAELLPMIYNAAKELPEGIKLHFFCGWRHPAVQWAAWERVLGQNRKNHSDLTEQEIKRITRMTVSDPSRGGFGPHQTGGAIDVTLVKDGALLDMGTPFDFHGIQSHTKYKKLGKLQKNNRRILFNALVKAGFVNYPREWWHYSYGDRMWAVYGHKPFAIYGKVDNKEYKLTEEELKYVDKFI